MSRFVSAGTTDDEPTERDAAWLEAQAKIDATRQSAQQQQHQNGKSLYETLQANKAAKQEAFEESIRLKNQFRTLDEEEALFLDAVLESTREQEAQLKRETSEQLDGFRRKVRDEAALQAASLLEDDGEDVGTGEVWRKSGGVRKRKKGGVGGGLLGGVKVRKTDSSATTATATAAAAEVPLVETLPEGSPSRGKDESTTAEGEKSTEKKPEPAAQTSEEQRPLAKAQSSAATASKSVSVSPPAAAAAASLGLGAYSSDEDGD